MENISALQNSYNNQLTPDVQNKTNNQENFTALDKEKLKKDSVEIANKAKENAENSVKENWFYKQLRKLGVENPQKLLISIGLAIGTTILMTVVGNKLSDKTAKLGQDIGDDIIGQTSVCKWFSNLFQNIKTGVGNFLKKSKTINELSETFKYRHATAKWDVARGYGDGFKGIFRLTPPDIIKHVFDKNNITNVEEGTNLLKKLVGEATDADGNLIAEKLSRHILNTSNNVEYGNFISKALNVDAIKPTAENAEDVEKAIEATAEAVRNAFGKAKNKRIEKVLNKNSRKIAEGLVNDNAFDFNALKGIFEKYKINDTQGAQKVLSNLVGSETTGKNNQNLAQQLVNYMFKEHSLGNKGFCSDLNLGMRKYIESNGLGTGNKAYLEALSELKKGKLAGADVSEFINVRMVSDSKFDIWHPISSLLKKLFNLPGDWAIADGLNNITNGKYQEYLTGNLGDALIKQNVVEGTLADTAVGKFIQRLTTIPTESFGNHTNDKSMIGVMICGSTLIPLFNNIQDAPKEKKLPTFLNDFVGGIGTFALSLPISRGISYGLATLANTDTSKSVFLKILKPIGDFFNAGLDGYIKDKSTGNMILKWSNNKAIGNLAGVGRLILIAFILQPFVSKTINKVVSKIFGKPYDPSEAAKEKQLEEAKKQVIPELGITQGELLEKMEKNPEVMAKIQKDPELLAKVQNDPKALLDLLDGKDNKTQEASKNPFGQTISPATKSILENRNKTNAMPTNSTNKLIVGSDTNKIGGKKSNTKNDKTTDNNTVQIDNLTYIPSSDGMVKSDSILSPEQLSEYNKQMEDADKILKRAEKYI